jgi:hypothetical protein
MDRIRNWRARNWAVVDLPAPGIPSTKTTRLMASQLVPRVAKFSADPDGLHGRPREQHRGDRPDPAGHRDERGGDLR